MKIAEDQKALERALASIRSNSDRELLLENPWGYEETELKQKMNESFQQAWRRLKQESMGDKQEVSNLKSLFCVLLP